MEDSLMLLLIVGYCGLNYYLMFFDGWSIICCLRRTFKCLFDLLKKFRTLVNDRHLISLSPEVRGTRKEMGINRGPNFSKFTNFRAAAINVEIH